MTMGRRRRGVISTRAALICCWTALCLSCFARQGRASSWGYRFHVSANTHQEEANGRPKRSTVPYFDRLRGLIPPAAGAGAPRGVGAAAADVLRCVEEQQQRGWEPRRPGRPLYILALGTEGTGHHALRSLLLGVADREFIYNPKEYLAPGKQFVTVQSDLPLEWTSSPANSTHQGRELVVFDSQHSCPFGPTRRESAVTRCPDVVRLLGLHAAGKLDLRVVLLHRDPSEAVLSALRRGFARDSAEQQLRTIEFSLGHLEALFRALPCGLRLLLPYPLLLQKPPDLPEALSGFLGLPNSRTRIARNLERERWVPKSITTSTTTASPSPSSAATNLDRLSLCSDIGVTGAPCAHIVEATVQGFFRERLHTWPFLAAMLGLRVGAGLLPCCPALDGGPCVVADVDRTVPASERPGVAWALVALVLAAAAVMWSSGVMRRRRTRHSSGSLTGFIPLASSDTKK